MKDEEEVEAMKLKQKILKYHQSVEVGLHFDALISPKMEDDSTEMSFLLCQDV